ncbi:hypothetical protein A4A49_21334 [Nicotiana attenuata]|uniref:Uncharacterized protein n=1 Tax=Nicotiana attenuata TaxID=49451 RepID=A0A1J6I7K9_NICAT|nr:hypothetical protein A4A49_21334 [Nicotiana attenuata]
MQHVPNVALKPIEYLHGEPIVRWKKQEVRQSIAQQRLHMAVLGTAATATKVLTSGKEVGKPIANPARQEWMQARKNKYQRDKRGYIIDVTNEKEDNKGKGKAKEEAVVSKNKFEALEVEEDAQPILTITDGNVDGNGKNKGKDQVVKGNSKGGDTRKLLDKEGGNSSLNKEEFDARRVKKEAVDKANKEREAGLQKENLNPTSLGVQSSVMGTIADSPSTVPSPIDSRVEEEARKEATIDWVHIRFGTNKEELRQCNVNTNHSCQEIPSQTYEDAGQLEDGNEVSSKKALWSDEVELMEEQLDSKKSTDDKEDRDNMQLQKTVNLDDATVNISSSTTRVHDSLRTKVDQDKVLAGGDQEKGMDLEKQRHLSTAQLAKE